MANLVNEILSKEHDGSSQPGTFEPKRAGLFGWDGLQYVKLAVDSSGQVKIDPTNLDTRYLKLDASNDPVTGAIQFQNSTDSTTGFQVLDADGGTPILNIDTTNERVGIGIAAPLQPLHIVGAGANLGAIRIDNTNAGACLIANRTDGKNVCLQAGPSAAQFAFDNTGAFGIAAQPAAEVLTGTFSSTTYGIYMTNGNRTGFRNTNPQARVHINTIGSTTKGLIVQGAASQSADYLQILDSADNIIHGFGVSETVFNEQGSDINFRVEGVGKVNALFVEGSTGNVGINTNAPEFGFAFDGENNNVIGVNEHSTGDGKGIIFRGGAGAVGSTDSDGGAVVFSSGNSTGSGGSEVRFETATAGGSGTTTRVVSQKMVIASNGRVGIGEGTPDNLLHIKLSAFGASQFKELIKIEGVNLNTPAAGYGVNIVCDIESLGGQHEAGRFGVSYSDVTDGSEESRFRIQLMTGGAAAADAWFFDGDGSTLTPVSQLLNVVGAGKFTAQDPDDIGLITKGAASQTSNLQEWQDSAGTPLSVVDSAGFLGLGTNSPTYPLDVTAEAGVINAVFGDTLPFYLHHNNPTFGFNSYFDGAWKAGRGSTDHYGATFEFTPASGKMQFRISSAKATADGALTMQEKMTILQTGFVGINKTDPGAPLHLIKSSVGTVIFAGSDADAFLFALNTNATGWDLIDHGGGSFQTSISSRSGLVGIRESTPGATLHVTSPGAAVIGQIIKGAASQSANLQEWQDSNAAILTYIEPDGEIIINQDSKAIKFGVGQDMSIYYDGLDGNIDTDLIAPSDLIIDCGTDKTIELEETVWKDINIGAATLSGPPGLQPGIANYIDEAGADTGIATLGIAVGEGLSGQFEIQHDYKEGTDLVFHLHWQGITAPTGTDNIQWQLSYTVSRANETLDAVTIITTETGIDIQYDFKFSTFTAITGTNFKIGDQFLFTLQRIAASANEYGGEALLATVGIHYQIDTIGSRQMIIK